MTVEEVGDFHSSSLWGQHRPRDTPLWYICNMDGLRNKSFGVGDTQDILRYGAIDQRSKAVPILDKYIFGVCMGM